MEKEEEKKDYYPLRNTNILRAFMELYLDNDV